jgi:hypothetical protein
VGMCRRRRIARFGSLCEEWRPVLFELVFAFRYPVASTVLSPRSFGGFLYSPVRLPQGSDQVVVVRGCYAWLARGHGCLRP